MRRLVFRAALLAAAAFATTGCASLGLGSKTPAAAPAAVPNDASTAEAAPGTPYADMINKQPVTLDGEIRRAQLLRAQGDFAGAIHSLSQLMLVAPDDPRIVGEYGKVLAQQGRSADALDFLKRAIELQPDNWTFYSAEGVAFDQQDQRDKAEAAYKHALALNPENPSVLNNYAMSQMMAGNLDRAEQLLNEAAAHGADYPKIAGNLQMITTMRAKKGLPAGPQSAIAPASAVARKAAPKPAPVAPVEVGAGAPRALVHMPAKSAHPRVVMQQVPYDPLAGKVYGHASESHVADAKAPPHKLADAKPTTKQAALEPAKTNAPALRTAADIY